jgi:hypothetical protein
MPALYRISLRSSLPYLPFIFLIPEDMMDRFPTIKSLPRCMAEMMRSTEHMDTLYSDMFMDELFDAVASLVFPHLGFRGWREHYSANSPVWILSYALPIWRKALEEETGRGLQQLFNLPSSTVFPFLEADRIKELMSRVVKHGIASNNLQPVIDIVKALPCEEDFEKWDTNIRKDFLRSWYHTRAKHVQTISLETCLEDEEHHIHDIEDESEHLEDNIVAEDYYDRFKSQLSSKDMQILQMRVDGLTYGEIALELGYKNHSGVIKRIRAITKEFTKYENKEAKACRT